jgi:hypothetical protein
MPDDSLVAVSAARQYLIFRVNNFSCSTINYPVPEIFHGLFIKDIDSIFLNLPAG